MYGIRTRGVFGISMLPIGSDFSWIFFLSITSDERPFDNPFFVLQEFHNDLRL